MSPGCESLQGVAQLGKDFAGCKREAGQAPLYAMVMAAYSSMLIPKVRSEHEIC